MKKSFYSVAILFTILLLLPTVRADSPQPRILLVKDAHYSEVVSNPNEVYGEYYENALEANGLNYDVCVVAEGDDNGPGYSDTGGCDSSSTIDSTGMQNYDIVIWFTGDDYGGDFPTLTDTDQEELATYLDNGGKLFISGQDIGFDIGTTSFYSNYLHAYYCKNDADDYDLVGREKDSIGNNLLLNISVGAGNQKYPSMIFYKIGDRLYDVNSFYYRLAPLITVPGVGKRYVVLCDDGRILYNRNYQFMLPAAIKNDTGGPLGYKVVYFAFGFEGIASDSNRNKVMKRIYGYLSAPATLNTRIYANQTSKEGENLPTPILNLTCDPDDTYCLRAKDPLMNATCKDNQLFANVSGAEYFVDGVKEGDAKAYDGSFNDDDNYENVYEYINAHMTAGTHKLELHCNDTDGYWGKNDTYFFTIDRTPPSIDYLELESGRNYTSSEKPNIDISVAVGPIDYMRFSCNISENWTEWIPFSTFYSGFNITNSSVGCPITDGNRTIYLQTIDNAGNLQSSNYSTDWIILDRKPPSVSINTPLGPVSGNVTINATVTDATSYVDMVMFKIKNESWSSSWREMEKNGNNYNYTWNSKEVADGNYDLIIWANDSVNNINNTEKIEIEVDNTPPIITVERPKQDQTYSGIVDLLTTITDEHPDQAWYEIRNATNLTDVEANGTLSGPNWDATWNSTQATNENGTFIFNVSANDTLGQLTFNINVTFKVDNRLPSVFIHYPNKIYNNSNFNLDLRISSPGAPDVNLSYAYYNISNSSWSKLNESGNISDKASYNFTDLIDLASWCNGTCKDGNYSIYLWANNTNLLNASDTSWFYIDTKHPEAWNYRINVSTDPSFNDSRIYPGEGVEFKVNVSEDVLEVDQVLVTIKPPTGNEVNYTLTPEHNNYKNDTWYFVHTQTNQLGIYNITQLYVNDTLGNLLVNPVNLSFRVVNGSLSILLDTTDSLNANCNKTFNLTFQFNKTVTAPNIVLYIPPNTQENYDQSPNYINLTTYECNFGSGCQIQVHRDSQNNPTLLNITTNGNGTELSLTTTLKAQTPTEDTDDEWILRWENKDWTNLTHILTPYLNISQILCNGNPSCEVNQNEAFYLNFTVSNVNSSTHKGVAFEVSVRMNTSWNGMENTTPIGDLLSNSSEQLSFLFNITEAGNYTFTFDAWEKTNQYNATQRSKLVQVKDTEKPIFIDSYWDVDNIFNRNETVVYWVKAKDNVEIGQTWVEIKRENYGENISLILDKRYDDYDLWKLEYKNDTVGIYNITNIYLNDTAGNLNPTNKTDFFQIKELKMNISINASSLQVGQNQTFYANVSGNASEIESVKVLIQKPRGFNETLYLTDGKIDDLFRFNGTYSNITRSGDYIVDFTVLLTSGINLTNSSSFSSPYGNPSIKANNLTLIQGATYNLTLFIFPQNGDLLNVNGTIAIGNESVVNTTEPKVKSLSNITWEKYNASGFKTGWEINANNTGESNLTLWVNCSLGGNKSKTIWVKVVENDTQNPNIWSVSQEYPEVNLKQTNPITINASDDETEIANVTVQITYPSGGSENLTASLTPENLYKLDFSNTNETGNFSYKVFAYDIAGNVNVSEEKSFNVTSVYKSVSVSLTPYNKGDNITFTVSVIDVRGQPVKNFNLTLILYRNKTGPYTVVDNKITDTGWYRINSTDAPESSRDYAITVIYGVNASVEKDNNIGNFYGTLEVSEEINTRITSPRGYTPPNKKFDINVEANYMDGRVAGGAAVTAYCPDCPDKHYRRLEWNASSQTYYLADAFLAPTQEFDLWVFSTDYWKNEGMYGVHLLTEKPPSTTLPGAAGPSVPGALPTCDCSDWKEVGCGAGNCSKLEMYMLRTCNPAGCAPEQQCVESPICKGENFLFNLTDSVEVEQGEGKKLVGSLANIGNLPLTINLSLEKECCEISIVPSSFDLPVNSEKTVTIPIHVPLNTSVGEYLMKITARSKNLVKVKSVKILVKENPNILSLQNLEKELNELEKVILEYKKAGINVQELEDAVSEARATLQTGKNAIGEDKLQTLTNSVNELQDKINYIRTRLLALKLMKFLNENKWNIIGGIIAVIILSYVTTEIIIPLFRIRSEIRKLEFEEDSIIKSRKETEKHYFLRKIDESTFRRVIAEKQSELYKVIATIKLKKEERSKLVRTKLNPLSFFKWCKEKVSKLKKK